MLFFQIVACLTYSAFLVLMLVFPVGVWILHRMEGGKTPWSWLLRTSWLLVVYIAFLLTLILAQLGGHEAGVAELSLRDILAGYGSETLLFFQHSWDSIVEFQPIYFLWALPPAVFGFFTARALRSGEKAEGEVGRDRRWYAVLCFGLIALAAACYLPYAASDVRFGAERELFGAGIFLYTLFLLPVFIWLPRRLRWPRLPWLLVALLVGSTTLTGLEKREFWTSSYRTQEQLLAKIAATVPQPPPDTMFVIHLQTGWQAKSLGGIYNRRRALELALHLMYGDRTLRAAFTPYRGPLFEFKGNQVSAVQLFNDNKYDSFAPVAKTVILDYGPDGKMHVLDRTWLQQNAPKGTDLTAYAPGGYGTAPRADAIVCTMLEPQFRPAYCATR